MKEPRRSSRLHFNSKLLNLVTNTLCNFQKWLNIFKGELTTNSNRFFLQFD